MKDKNAVLLANHGLLAVGANLQQAFYVAEMVEFCAEIYYRAKCIGDPAVISDEEMLNIKEKFKTYGQIKRNQDLMKS
jgi:L-fuculose-phosphate aldolase